MEDQGYNLVGQTLGTCTLEKLIGQGGMGSVYLASQVRPQRNVAVKVLIPNRSMGNQQDFLARFRREADVIAKLEHVNIMPIYEYGEKDGLAYLVMPYLSGGSLREVLSKQGSLSLEVAAAYIDQAAQALDYAHGHGVIHRDLKPANFLLHADGRLVLADFGIARIMNEQTQGSTLTGVGTVLGTPEYMAPEMARGEQIDYRADIYELGVVLYQMLAGSVPFSGATPYAVFYKHVQETLPLLQYVNVSIPPAVDAVIQKATAKNREDRYATVKAMAQELHAAISNVPTLYVANHNQNGIAVEPPPPPPQRNSNPAQANPSLAYPSYSTHISQMPAPSYPSYSTNTHTGQTPASPNDYVPFASPAYAPPQAQYQQPYQPAYQPPPPRRPHTWLIVLAVVCALITVAGVLFAALRIDRRPSLANNPYIGGPVVAGSNTQPAPILQPTPADAPTIPSQPTNMQKYGNIPAGGLLYITNAPGCNNANGRWIPYNGALINCQAGLAQIISTAQKKAVQGVFLTKIPGHPYPSDYVVQAYLQPNPDSTGSFGIYFRNQPGNQLGAYTFMLNPRAGWYISVYDNNTGLPTVLKEGVLSYPFQGSVQMAVVVKGSQFSFYIDGHFVGGLSDQTYATGNCGIVVGPGAGIAATHFSLSKTIE